MEEKIRMRIKADKEDLAYLMKVFNVSNVSVWGALNYRKGDRELHRKIRKAAIEHGCKVVMEVLDMECFYFTDENGERCMVQKFPNGASLTSTRFLSVSLKPPVAKLPVRLAPFGNF